MNTPTIHDIMARDNCSFKVAAETWCHETAWPKTEPQPVPPDTESVNTEPKT